MDRTRNRRLPARRMTLDEGLIIGITCSVAGVLWLSFATNIYAAVLSALTIGVYVFAVSGLEPSKRVFEFFTFPIRNKNLDG